MSKLQEVKAMVEQGKTKLIAGKVQEALDEGNKAEDIL
ncbi:MAG TPA: cobalamin-binding protein, partial [Syntrophomonadaceae bacterium]|nr:cobalamin-binding protein [Syntrophomonadaceae bacterium]